MKIVRSKKILLYFTIGFFVIIFLSKIFQGDPLNNAETFHFSRKANSHSDNLRIFNKAVDNYISSIKSTNFTDKNKKKHIKSIIKLANLYHEGIPDRYNRSGVKIRGVEPNIPKAIEYYLLAYKKGNKSSLLDVGGIYQWEIGETVEGDKTEARKRAKEIYNMIRNSELFGYYLKRVAEDRLLQMEEEDGKVFNFGKMNFGPLQTINSIYSQQFQNIQPALKNVTKRPQRMGQPTRNKRERLREIQNPRINFQIFGFRANTNQDNKEIRNDPHNAHDHVVINSIKKAVEKLRNSTDILSDNTTTLYEIRDLINNSDKLSDDKRIDAVKALDRIEQSTTPLSYTNESEVDALNLVWNRIHNKINEKNRENLKENLLNELAECVEHDRVVCSTGRFNRILDSLNAVDPEVSIKPKWVINQEMMNKAAKIRNDLYSDCTEADKKLIDSGEENDKSNSFDKSLKEQIRSQFKKDYLETGLMTEKILEAELNKWIDDI